MKSRDWTTLGVLGIMPLAMGALMLTACNGPDAMSGPGSNSVLPDSSVSDPVNPPISTAPSIPGTPVTPTGGNDHAYVTDALLFNGAGVSTSDWQSTEQI